MSVIQIAIKHEGPEDQNEMILWPRNTRSAAGPWELNVKLRLYNRTWVRQAACYGVNPDVFFPEDNNIHTSNKDEAIKICQSCPVRLDCLIWSIKSGEDNGIWGGTSAKDRRRLRRHYPNGMTREQMVQFLDINVEQYDREPASSGIQPIH